jgi:hypothetical protein
MKKLEDFFRSLSKKFTLSSDKEFKELRKVENQLKKLKETEEENTK